MATFSKVILSGSTNGKGILLTSGSDPGTTIHTVGTGTSNMDEVWLYGVNNDTSPIVVTFFMGGNTIAEQIIVSIPGKSGLQLIVPGFVYNNSMVIKAFAEVLSKVSISGFVNRITA